MLSKEFITERGRNSSDEFAVDPNAKPAEIPAWLKKAGSWLGNKIGLKEPVALPDYTASNQQDAAARSRYTGIDPVQRQQAGMAPATQQEINRYMRDNPAVVGGLTDRNGNPIVSGGAQEVERAARAAAPRRGADFDVDAEVGAVDPAVIGNRFKTPRELGFYPGGSTASAAENPGDITLDKIKAAAGIPAAVPAAAAAEVEIGAPIPTRSLKANTQPLVKKSFDEPVASAPAPMKGGYGSGMNNPSVAQQTRVAESDTNRILELAGLLKSSEFLNEETTAPMAQPAATAGQQFVGTGSSSDLEMSDTIAMTNATSQMLKKKYGNRPPPGNGIELKYYNQQKQTVADPAKPGNYLTTVTFTPIESKLSPAISFKPSMDPNQDFDYFINGQQVKPGDAFFDRIKQIHSSLGAGAVPTQPEATTNETAELDRILRLSGMEFISEDSTKSVTVQRGDTLGKIARDNSTTVSAIVKLNNIANPDRIYPGDVIRIPGGQGDPGGRAKRQAQSPAPDIDSDTDTDSDNSSRVERAWLNMIAREESSDDYNAINFEAKKAMKKGTMRITGKPGQHPFDGQSGVTAAGRYQMLYNTWKTAAKLAGVDPNDFSPKNQDRAAFALAKNEYKRKYPNRDLVADLQDPKRVDQAVRGSTGPWSVEAGGPGFSTQDYVSALSDIRAA
jgi:LysM repeat protein